jgi:hypothetical protein
MINRIGTAGFAHIAGVTNMARSFAGQAHGQRATRTGRTLKVSGWRGSGASSFFTARVRFDIRRGVLREQRLVVRRAEIEGNRVDDNRERRRRNRVTLKTGRDQFLRFSSEFGCSSRGHDFVMIGARPNSSVCTTAHRVLATMAPAVRSTLTAPIKFPTDRATERFSLHQEALKYFGWSVLVFGHLTDFSTQIGDPRDAVTERQERHTESKNYGTGRAKGKAKQWPCFAGTGVNAMRRSPDGLRARKRWAESGA